MASNYGDVSLNASPDFPMVQDKRTEMYIKFAKIMIIFQGAVTEDRSKLVSTIENNYKHSCRVISDATYTKETSLSFIPENTEDFYKYFKFRAKKSCEDGFNLIVINQSMSNSSQMNYFLFLAQKFQYVVIPIPPMVTEKSLSRGRPKENQASSFQRDTTLNFPNYFIHRLCGWFLHDMDTAELRDEVNWYVKDCFDDIPEFDDFFSRSCKPHTFKKIFQMEDMRQNLAFCCVKIFKTPIDTKQYMSEEAFLKHYTKMSKLYIVGFIISPHMVAARVKLTHDQKKLWMLPDDLPEKFRPSVYISDIIKELKIDMPSEEINLCASKSNRTVITGEHNHEPEQCIPYNAKGRSCHILLGQVKGAPKRNVDYDVPFAVCRERSVVTDPKYCDNVKPYELRRCHVRRIGKYWFIYLKDTIIVNGILATYCSAEKNLV